MHKWSDAKTSLYTKSAKLYIWRALHAYLIACLAGIYAWHVAWSYALMVGRLACLYALMLDILAFIHTCVYLISCLVCLHAYVFKLLPCLCACEVGLCVCFGAWQAHMPTFLSNFVFVWFLLIAKMKSLHLNHKWIYV